MAQAEWNALRVAANDQNNLSLKKKKKKSWLCEVWLLYYSSPYVRDIVRFLKKSQTSCLWSSPGAANHSSSSCDTGLKENENTTMISKYLGGA